MISRRQLIGAAASLPAAAAFGKINSNVNGVMLGVQSYSFRDRSLDQALEAMAKIGLGYCELWSGHVEPKDAKGKEDWRKNPPLAELAKVRKKFKDAGVTLYAFNYSFRETYSDAEVENGFVIAKALGTSRITASANVSTAERIDRYASKHRVFVGMHNHSRIVKNEFATPDDFEAAMKGRSKYIAINLDIGHFVAANFDPVDYLSKNHQRIVTLHLKDRLRDQGDNVPFGKGQTPIKDVLALLKKYRWRIPANIEYEYRGADAVEEVKKCFEYCKSVIA